jgi:hypothetical protein
VSINVFSQLRIRRVWVLLAIVPDANDDGRINAADLRAYGIASNIAVVPFEIHD